MIKRWSHKVDWRESDIGSIFTSVEADEDPKGQYVLYKDHEQALLDVEDKTENHVASFVIGLCDKNCTADEIRATLKGLFNA